MKLCKICNIELIAGENITLSQFKISNFKCKSCKLKETYKYKAANKDKVRKHAKTGYLKRINYYKNMFNKHKDGFHYVYYLPEHHYAGVTSNLKWRMRMHKNNANRFVDNIEIVYKTPCRKEAELVESKLHSLGYQG